MDTGERIKRGAEMRRKVLGDAWVEKTAGNRNAFNAEWLDTIFASPWCDVWTRPHFDERTRRILVIGTLLALARWDEFQLHVRSALTVGGFSPEDIKEIILQQSAYAGVPLGNHAMQLTVAILKDIGKLPK